MPRQPSLVGGVFLSSSEPSPGRRWQFALEGCSQPFIVQCPFALSYPQMPNVVVANSRTDMIRSAIRLVVFGLLVVGHCGEGAAQQQPAAAPSPARSDDALLLFQNVR